MKRLFVGVALTLALLATALSAQSGGGIRLGNYLDCTRGPDAEGNVRYCIETASVGDNATHTSLPTALAALVPIPPSPSAALALTYQDGVPTPWDTRQLTAPALGDDSVIARTILGGVITPSHLDTSITTAQWQAVLGFSAAGSGGGLPAGGTANQWLRKKSAVAHDVEWADLPSTLTARQMRILAAAVDPQGFTSGDNGVVSAWFGAEWVNARIPNSTITDNPSGPHSLNLPDASNSHAGLQSSDQYGKVASLPNQGATNADKFIGFNSSGNYAAVDAPSGGGGLTTVATESPVLGAGTTADPIHVTAELEAVNRHYEDGGWQAADGYQISIGRHTAAQPVITGITYANETDPISPRYTDGYFVARIPAIRTYKDSEISVASIESDPNTVLRRTFDELSVTSLGVDGEVEYFRVLIDSVFSITPGTRYRVEVDNPSELNIKVPVDDILGISGYVDEQIDDHPSNHVRLIYEGSAPGLSVTSLSADSSINRFNLGEPFNLETEPHGVLLLLLTPRTSGFVATDVGFVETEYSNETTIASLARAPPYNGSTQLGDTVITADVNKGSTLAGSVVVRLARDDHGNVGGNIQYVHHAGHSLTDTGSVLSTLEIYLIGSGAERGAISGQWFQFDALPSDASAFTDGDLILVKTGTNQGAWVKSSTETTDKADTGLAGETLTNSDLGTAQDGAVEHLYFSRSSFTGDNGATIPANTSWSDAPAALARLDFAFRSATLDNGIVELVFSSARSYTGRIQVNTAGGTIVLQRDTATRWVYDNADASTVRFLRQALASGAAGWSFTEPGVPGYTVTHSLDQVLAGLDSYARIHEVTWSGDQSLTLSTNGVVTAWTDIQTISLPAGLHHVWINMHITHGGTNAMAWLGLEIRLQKDGATVWNAPGRERINLRGTGGERAVKELAMVSGSGDYVLQVRGVTDAVHNASPLGWAAANQGIQVTTFGG